MRRTQAGFTLIELLIVISIIGLLAAVLLPTVFASGTAANAEADRFNLRTHFSWLTLYQMKHKRALPPQGGHEFVLATWRDVVQETEENFDRYFTPGRRDNDPDYRTLRAQVERKETIWTDLKGTTSIDTHYAGRAREHLQSATSGEDEAWMANDNEGVWAHPDGTVNVLFNGGAVRGYSYPDLQSRGLVQGVFDKSNPIETTGPNSPIPECRKLAQ